MKIVHLVPGSGGTFYCENCLRDAALVKALRGQGHDVVMAPLYLPIFTDAEQLSGETPVFFGGVNVYLQQKYRIFRYTPRWFDSLFDSPWVLKKAALREGSTSAEALGPMTLSMLRGRHGRQRKEFDRLLHWLQHEVQPGMVHISNALLLGLAAPLKESLGVPVLCSLQDEDTWLEATGEPHASQCWEAMAKAAKHVDCFVAVSQWYADKMKRQMRLADGQVEVVPLGTDFNAAAPREEIPEPPVLGFLSRLSACLGLDRLVDAYLELRQRPGLSNLRLHATGGVTEHDKELVQSLMRRLANAGAGADVTFVSAFDHAARYEFLRGLSVLSVPAPQGEAFGAFILEALSCGVPVVQPAVGGFPEVVAATAGGLIYDPGEPGAYVEALASLLLDGERARSLGEQGRQSVVREFNITTMAGRLAACYERVAAGAAS